MNSFQSQKRSKVTVVRWLWNTPRILFTIRNAHCTSPHTVQDGEREIILKRQFTICFGLYLPKMTPDFPCYLTYSRAVIKMFLPHIAHKTCHRLINIYTQLLPTQRTCIYIFDSDVKQPSYKKQT